MKKKTIIIVIGGIISITSAIVIPIIVIGNNNDNNDQKNKEDVEAIIKILKSKSSSQKTLILEGNSTGKIIGNNKLKIITKIKKLIGFEKLRGVKFDVSLENDVDISTTEKFIIVTIKKEKHSQQLKGKNGLKVKRAKNVQEIKIDTIKEYLNNSDNLNLNLPKTNYSTDNEILIAIRKLLATQINNIEIDDTHLITKKENSSEIVSVSAHSDDETTPYEITIDDEDFTLKLNQEEFSENEKTKINVIKIYLENENNLNLMLPKKTYSTDDSILDAIKLKLVNDINDILSGDSHLIVKKEDSTQVSSINTYDSSTPTLYKITIGKYDFTLKLNQEEFSEDEKNVKNIKQSLESLTSKEITIDTSSGSINNNKNLILEKLQTLSGYPSYLKGVSLSIKDSSDSITLEGIAFTILLSKGSVVNEELRGFKVKRSQSQVEIDQNDVNEIKVLLNALTSKEVTIDASSGSINNNKNLILEKLQALSDYPSDLKGVSLSIKDSSDSITLEGIAFTILLSKDSVVNEELRGFKVKRSQSQAEIDQNDINEVERLLNALTSKEVTIDASSGSITTNKNLILEKLQTLSDYPSDLKGVSLSIKDSSDSITLEGIAFTILLSKDSVVNEKLRRFTVKRSQSQAEIDQNDINEVERLLNALTSKEVIIDASSGSITTNKNSILEKIQTLSGYPSDLKGVIVSIKEEETEINLEGVAFTIELSKGSVVNEELRGFTVKRSQAPIEKIKNNIKEHLKISINLDIFLPKDIGSDYDEDSKILTAIRKKLEILKPLDFSKNDFDNLITKKQSPSPTPITEVATHSDEETTPYEITVDGEDFTLQLKQNQYTSEEEKNTIINSIKNYLGDENNLNIILPKIKDFNYDEDSKILTAIKTKLIDSIPNFKNYDANLIVKEGSVPITGVANHDATNPTEYKIIVDGEHFTLKLKQDQFTEEEKTKINAIKKHFETPNNLNLILPQTTYDNNDDILDAIKLKLENDIESISSSDSYLINRKDSNIVEVAIHNQPSTQYIIVVGEHEFTLNLNQDQFTESEKTKINAIEKYFETSSNLNLILPKTTYSDDNSILEAIKSKLENNIKDISSFDSYLITKKVGSVVVNLVAVHGQSSTQYIIVVGKDEFTLNLNQDQFSELEKTKINAIKKHFEISSNLNLILPQITHSDDSSVLAAIKLKLINDINDITNDDSHLIVKKVGSVMVTLVATHSQPPTHYIIVVGKDEFTLNLNQDQFSELEKTKINAIEKHFEISSNLNLILPKTTYDDNNDDILNAIKLKLENDIESISSSDYHLINRKDSTIVEVAIHNQPSTQYIIVVGEHEFTLNLNQDQFTKLEKTKIINIKNWLNTLDNLNIILPKDIDSNYDQDSKILNAIKKVFVDNISSINDDDFDNLITKKEGSEEVTSVAAYDATSSNPYEIVVGEDEFTLNLKQDQFTESKKTKINTIKTYLENLDNFNFILPKVEDSNYDEDSKILKTIKTKIVNDINDITNDDSHLIVKEDLTPITEVAIHNQPSTQYIIVVGEHEFTLNLNQDQFTESEKTKINAIKKHFETSSNLNIILPKTAYDNNDDILNAIKLKLVNDIESISSSDYHLINRKDSNIVEVAIHNQPSTQYIIVVGKDEFTLNLNQEQFSESEKIKINVIKKHFETSSNLNLILPKTIYSNDNSVLAAIKLKLINDINDITNDDSHLIVKKVGSVAVTLVATHSQPPAQYIIIVGEHEFTLNLNQDQFTEEEKTKINVIKKHFETSSNLNLILPKTTYSNNDDILNAIKLKLENDIESISSSDYHLINRKDLTIDEVALHSEPPTQYIIVVGEDEFTLNLNQDQFTESEKIKISAIEKHFETLGNLNLILPLTTYSDDNSILEAIKLKLENNIEDISSFDSYLITKKADSVVVTSVATHSQPPTQYIITIGEEDFILQIKQDQFTKEEKTKIFNFKILLKTINNLGISLPKDTGSDYDEDSKILTAIRKFFVDQISWMNNDDFDNWITKKQSSSPITSIATHDHDSSTSYIIVVDKEEFTLKLKQDKFNEEEKRKIIAIKTHLDTPSNLNLVLPKTTYVADDKILREIRKKLVNDIKGISNIDSHLIVKKVGSSAITSIAAYDQSTTSYGIKVGEDEFTLNLNQDQFTKKERKIHLIKIYLENLDNFKFILPKNNNYYNSRYILQQIQFIILKGIIGISTKDSYLIKEKNLNQKISKIAVHGRPPTSFIILVGKHKFTLKLNQDQFTIKQKENAFDRYLRRFDGFHDGFHITIPKTTYSNKSDVLEAVRLKFINNIKEITIYDSYLFDFSKSFNFKKIPFYRGKKASGAVYQLHFKHWRNLVYNITLRQDRFTEQEKNEKIKIYLQNNLNLILPKSTYGNDDRILEAIKLKIVNGIADISKDDSYLITKKQGSIIVDSVPVQSEEAISYEITIDGQHFTLKLNQKN